MDSEEHADERLARRRFVGAGLGVAAFAGLAATRSASAGVMTAPNLTNLISVLDYGADPTGTGDSTVAIQNAIYAAMNPAFVVGNAFQYPLVQGEAAVFFPTGKYKITDTLHITGQGPSQTTNNISLIGMRAAIFQQGAGRDIMRFENTSHCMIKDLYLSGTAQSGHGIKLLSAYRTVLDNVEVYQVGGNCLYADKSFWLSAYDCIFALPGPNKYAVHHQLHMNNVSYYHCRFAGSPTQLNRGGLYTANSTVVSIVACDFSFGKVGLKVYSGGNTYVANCWFEANERAVQWGHYAGDLDPVTGDLLAQSWPYSGTLDNCLLEDRELSHEPVLLDVRTGTNLRINNPYLAGNGTASSTGTTIGIYIHATANPQHNRRIVIDDVPFLQFVATPVKDDGKRLKLVATQPYP